MRKLVTAAAIAGTALIIVGCAPRVVYGPPPPPVVYVPPPPPPAVVYAPPAAVYVAPASICRWQARRVVRADGIVVVRRVRVCR